VITPEQIEFRKGKLGGSDVGSALGLSPWKTPAQLAAQILGHTEGFSDSIAARVGNYMESHIAEEYQIIALCTGNDWRKITEYSNTLVHPDYPWLICHPDYVVTDNDFAEFIKLVEIKNVGHRVSHHWGAEGDEHGVPPYVVAQCAVQTLLNSYNEDHVDRGTILPVDVCAYFGGNDLRIYELNFTQEDLDQVLDKLIEFWSYVEKGEYPPVQAGDSKFMAELFPQSNKNPTEADVNIEKLCTDLRLAKDRKKVSEDDIDYLEARIKQEMGDHDAFTYHGSILATWKNSKVSKKTDVPASYERLCEAYSASTGQDPYALTVTKETGGGRRFLLKV